MDFIGNSYLIKKKIRIFENASASKWGYTLNSENREEISKYNPSFHNLFL